MMQAVLSWFRPGYSPPRTRAADALAWSWDNVTAEQIVPLRMNGNVLRNTVSLPTDLIIRSNTQATAKEIIHENI